MNINLLFVDVYIAEEDEVKGPGYIHLSNGVIDHIGVGSPPEEAEIAELVLGGRGRIVFPGFCAPLVYPEAYLFRTLRRPPRVFDDKLIEFSRSLSSEEAYYLSLMAFYEMSLAGYTRILAVSPNAVPVARALIESGLEGAILLPISSCNNCSESYFEKIRSEIEQVSGGEQVRVKLGALIMHSEGIVLPSWMELVCKVMDRSVAICNGINVRAYGHDILGASDVPGLIYPHISPGQVIFEYGAEGYKALSLRCHKIIDTEYRGIEKNERAYLAVYDISEPPSWFPETNLAKPYVLTPIATAETVVSGGRLVVDGGEHLFIGSSATEKASDVLSNILKRINL
ncbi:hypothetical protein PYJP_13540 [Pyrofollis japonicus]|uniref:hypothetical protein n=1 Tax=Pyrofollis japonicus TaxID=3060460 RepID=UPI00295ACD34|nr:hypothetical protein [Pyrofollis japonicus]BEP18002.1 hypothetical protein PYJP_13540 [Pyrofollis japonicus]